MSTSGHAFEYTNNTTPGVVSDTLQKMQPSGGYNVPPDPKSQMDMRLTAAADPAVAHGMQNAAARPIPNK